jgi:tetratricopeptide (TPR) repeat protein
VSNRFLHRALAIFEKAGSDDPLSATALYNIGSNNFHQGRYTEAELMFERSHFMREKSLGSEHPDTITCLNNLAATYYREGRYAPPMASARQ